MFVKTPAEIGLLIRDARRHVKMTQAELAVRLNTTQGWVSEIENGKPTAELGMVLSALASLGVRLDAHTPSDARPHGTVKTKTPGPSLDDVLKRTRRPA